MFAADTRTNAGLDNISTFKKLHVWEKRGERVITLLSAGNLAVTQAVVSILTEHIAAGLDGSRPTLMNVETMFQAARIVGSAVREVRAIDGEALEATADSFFITFILGGQIKGEEPRLFQVYAAGNFIEVSKDTPFLQIGEHKYGKPILDRVARADMRLGEAAKLILLSFDSTLRSQPVRWPADRSTSLQYRQLHRRPSAQDREGRPLFPEAVQGLVRRPPRRLHRYGRARGVRFSGQPIAQQQLPRPLSRLQLPSRT